MDPVSATITPSITLSIPLTRSLARPTTRISRPTTLECRICHVGATHGIHARAWTPLVLRSHSSTIRNYTAMVLWDTTRMARCTPLLRAQCPRPRHLRTITRTMIHTTTLSWEWTNRSPVCRTLVSELYWKEGVEIPYLICFVIVGRLLDMGPIAEGSFHRKTPRMTPAPRTDGNYDQNFFAPR